MKEQSADLQSRLAAAGLIPGRAPGESLESFVENYLKTLAVKESTLDQLQVVQRSLCEYFGKDRDVTTITLQDASAYRTELLRNGSGFGKPMADNTVRRYVGRARQMFRSLGGQNPFDDRSLPVSVGHDESKDFFVSVPLILEVMDHAGSDEWRAAICPRTLRRL